MERTEELIDSFLDLNLLTPIKADFYRLVVYGNKGDMDNYIGYMRKVIKAFDQINDKAADEKRIYAWLPSPCPAIIVQQIKTRKPCA